MRIHRNLSIKMKLLLAYSILALLPMLLITFYTYGSTREILIEQLTDQISRNLDQDVKNIDEKVERLYSVSNILYTDGTLYNYLTMDYSDKGFEDIYYYVNSQLSRIKMLYPEIEQLSIHSNNETLPQDSLYFYYLDGRELEEWNALAGENGNAFQAAVMQEGRISFLRKMNLYESADYQMFLRVDISSSQLAEMIGSGGRGISYLQDEQGRILVSGEGAEAAGAGKEENESWMSLSKETKYCKTLTRCEDMSLLRNQARRSSSKVFMVFLAASVLAVTAIYLYCSYFKKNVDRIMTGARQIGEGNLKYRIEAASRDELGQVALEINRLGEKLDILIEDSYKKEIARRDSEMNLLQEQINPHFLYNALSSVSSLARRNKDQETCRAILSLADFYRISLNKGKKILTVREEIKLLDSYLAIQKIRFGDIIRVEYELDETLLEKEIIKLILQPIVENAIHHGRYNDQEEFHIRIRLFRRGDRMVFIISDDGVGMEAEQLMALQNSMEQAQDGMGLRNVNARIKLQYGQQFGVFLESQPFLGTIIRIELPVAQERGA